MQDRQPCGHEPASREGGGVVGDVRARVRDGGLVPAGAAVLVLLSGGRDSCCLLDAVVAVRGPGGVRALHVDHGLRDGTADRRACAALCDRLDVPLVVERLDPGRAAGNIAAWAREERYAAAWRLAGPDGAVAAAHTRDDQVETVLYRLAAAPGRRALLGMEPRRGRLVRPLLTTTRAQTTAYCAAVGIAYADDPTNASPDAARGRIRHEVVPALRAVHPAADENVLRSAEILREEAEVLDAVVDGALEGRDAIDRERLSALPAALGRLVLRRLAEDATGGLCPRAPGRLADVLALREGALDLGDGARAVVTAGDVRIVPTPPLPRRGGSPDP